MAHGFTYPRTSSDADNPVTQFKAELAKVIRRMADAEDLRAKTACPKLRDKYTAKTTATAYRAIADMCDNVIIEGE